jgi:hypothetical protein
MGRRLTLLSQERLNNTITADTNFQIACRGTSIVVPRISIITLFVVFQCTISADRSGLHRRFALNATAVLRTELGAAVTINAVTVIALFPKVLLAITTRICDICDLKTSTIETLQRIWTICTRATTFTRICSTAITNTVRGFSTECATAIFTTTHFAVAVVYATRATSALVAASTIATTVRLSALINLSNK